MSVWIAGAGLAAGVGGALISANGARTSANTAANANQAAINAQNQAAYQNWLASRGVDANGNSVNTTLPLWATTNGQPTEAFLLSQILGNSGVSSPNTNDPATYGSVDQIKKFFETDEGKKTLAEVQAALGPDETRDPAQWLSDHINATEKGNGTFSNLLRGFANAPAGTNGSLLDAGNQLPANIAALNTGAANTAAGVFNGGLRNEELAALAPVLAANTNLAQLQFGRNNEMRGNSQMIRDTEHAGLADLLGTRTSGINSIYDDAANTVGNVYGSRIAAAQGLFDTTNTAANNVYGARNTAADQLFAAANEAARNTYGARQQGANQVYGADLKYADTFSDATKQALARTLAQQQASNAIKGFEGASSGDALLKARTLSTGYQQSAGQRAGAGQTLARSLAKAGEMQAQDLGLAGTNRADTRGRAGVLNAQDLGLSGINFSDTTGRAGVSRAQDLGTASASRYRGLFGANEQDSMGRMTSNVNNATRLSGILDTDAAIAVAQAGLSNANATAGINGNDITRRLSNLGLANTVFNNQNNLSTANVNSRFTNLDAVLNRLGMFRSNNSTPPTPNAVQTQPGINTGQIVGSALGSVGSGLASYYQNQQMLNGLAGLMRPATTLPSNAAVSNGYNFSSPAPSMAPRTSLLPGG